MWLDLEVLLEQLRMNHALIRQKLKVLALSNSSCKNSARSSTYGRK